MELLSTVTDQPANIGELQELPIQGWSRDVDPVNSRLFLMQCVFNLHHLGLAKEATAQDIYFGLSTFRTLYTLRLTQSTHITTTRLDNTTYTEEWVVFWRRRRIICHYYTHPVKNKNYYRGCIYCNYTHPLKNTRDVSLLLKQQIWIYESTVILCWSGRAQYTALSMKLHV